MANAALEVGFRSSRGEALAGGFGSNGGKRWRGAGFGSNRSKGRNGVDGPALTEMSAPIAPKGDSIAL